MLPPELQAFVRLPFWSILFFLLSVGIIAHSLWSLGRRRQRQEVYFLLLGIYLTAVQLPAVIPSAVRGLPPSLSSLSFTPRFLLALPALLLFVLGVRAR